MPDAPEAAHAPPTGVDAPIVRRIVGGIYLAIGAASASGCLAALGWLGPAPEREEERGGEWLPLVLPLFLVMAWACAHAGYRVLTQPPLHRPRTVLLWCVALTIVFILRSRMR